MREHYIGCLITVIVIAASAAWAQPVRFQIGAYGVSNTASLTAGNGRWDTLLRFDVPV